jgi:hypothetical protein
MKSETIYAKIQMGNMNITPKSGVLYSRKP